MKYPVFIEWGNDKTATGMHIPDIPGAVTAGDTVEDAFKAAVEVAHIMIEEIVATGGSVPLATSVEAHKDNPDFSGFGVGYVEVDLSPYLGKTEKANLTMPSKVIRAIDRHVKVHNLKSRSAYLSELASKDLGV